MSRFSYLYADCRYTECRVSFIFMLTVVMLSVMGPRSKHIFDTSTMFANDKQPSLMSKVVNKQNSYNFAPKITYLISAGLLIRVR